MSLVALAAVALALAGCVGGGNTNPSEPPNESDGEATRIVNEYPAPEGVSIVGWLLDGDDEWTSDIATRSRAFTFDCMRDTGFDGYPIRTPPSGDGPPVPTPLAPLPSDQAAEIGYDAPAALRAPTWVDPLPDYVAGLSEQEQIRFGEANATCAEQERNVLFDGKFDLYESARGELDVVMFELFDEFYSSDQYRELSQAWSQCMSDAGFDFATPTEAINSTLSQGDEAGEVATAVADSACRAELGTQQQVGQLFREFEIPVLIDNEALVLEVMELSGRQVPEP